ncbi:GNAT family N-acetyltransferase [Draconibacterium sp. IB214405]|uniref:GNAT family N-acetyltransferase n=1 Tax=Draconibacterium sp. IB214405 TaxID=3097352 RepID=UPI002A182A5B|nr:N-acetyltransferase family protein [Draconibacterium sp. IB214405]MDX8339441.1 GNAT family N-acetyltransferase [Draconibacterium sp. IB214405]
MSNEIRLKTLEEKDLSLIKDIYNYYIANSTATFHTGSVSEDDLNGILPIGDKRFQSFLIEYNSELAGYCYLGRYKPRAAYDRTAEVTIYLKPEYFGKGIGREVLQLLEQKALEVGIVVLMGIITAENEASVKLFERMGYEKCGHFKQVGEKFGRILDVVAYQKLLDQ